MGFSAVIFDLGGVVLGSPLHAIARYERRIDIPGGFINRVIVDAGAEGAWSRLERGEILLDRFYDEFDRECAEAGNAISARDMMAGIAESGGPRPQMIAAIQTIRERGLRVAALTNNWASENRGDGGSGGLRRLFHVFVESSVVGLSKPDPRIYRHVCSELEVEPRAAVFLDDIGRNLKTARELGMRTIKVEDPDLALRELETALGFKLRSEPRLPS